MAPKKRPRPNEKKVAQELTAPVESSDETDFWVHFTPAQRAFLSAYSRTMRISDACRAARVKPHTTYMWRVKCPMFRLAFKRAGKMAADFIEEEAINRAVNGVPRKKFFKGEPIIDPETGRQYVEYSKSDYLMGRLLEACKPNKYRPQNQTTQNTVIVSDVPQQGKSLIDFIKEQAMGKMIQQAPQHAITEPTQSIGDDKPYSGNGNGNGKYNGNGKHGSNGNGKHGSNGNGNGKP